MAGTIFLDKYQGQSTHDLIGLEATHRIDSLVLAFAEALAKKARKDGMDRLTRLEKAVLAIEALEREVNNGGFSQFFLNAGEFAADIASALESVGLPKTAGIAGRAVALLGLEGPVTGEKAAEAVLGENQERDDTFSALDDAFYKYEEDIAGTLFRFIKDHPEEIELKRSFLRKLGLRR